MTTLTGFSASRPRWEVSQAELLAWLADAHADAEAVVARLAPAARDRFADKIRHALDRVGCAPAKIAARGISVDEVARGRAGGAIYDLARDPHGASTGARTRRFDELAGAYFTDAFARDSEPPDDLIHVTCTGYASPSAAQRLVAARGWGAHTRVTHAYHMGCYAALPAVRLADGLAHAGAARVDVVHTELCSLHLDPSDHRLEQLVVQSLFADGLIRYHATRDDGPGLALVAQQEWILPDSAAAMTWIASGHGMTMTLARDVPERIGAALREFVSALHARAGRADARRGVFAIHPGGPRIIDAARDRLQLDEAQVATSRAVLHDHGNMSSATLPHIWARLAADDAIPTGTPITSLAFGPGLTICGAVFEKR
jgi:predicted naringenin-chalcone synthase